MYTVPKEHNQILFYIYCFTRANSNTVFCSLRARGHLRSHSSPCDAVQGAEYLMTCKVLLDVPHLLDEPRFPGQGLAPMPLEVLSGPKTPSLPFPAWQLLFIVIHFHLE